MTLQDYTTEELKAELSRRSEQERKQREADRKAKRQCRNCIHYGTVDRCGVSTDPKKLTRWSNHFCPFKQKKNGEYYVLSKYGKACDHFNLAYDINGDHD